MNRAYRIDIDGTIAEPKFYDKDFQTVVRWYIETGIVTQEEVAQFQYHQQVYLLPHVLVNHVSFPGAVEVLRELAAPLEYFTVRQSFDPDICARIHQNTHLWLEQCHFPSPMAVRFFWDAGEKLVQSLEAPEEQVWLIDDRPAGLIKAYQTLTCSQPEIAQRIVDRVTVVAFGYEDTRSLPQCPLRVIPLQNWLRFQEIRSLCEKG